MEFRKIEYLARMTFMSVVAATVLQAVPAKAAIFNSNSGAMQAETLDKGSFAESLSCIDSQGNRLSIFAGKHITATLRTYEMIDNLLPGFYGSDLGEHYGRQINPGILRSVDSNGARLEHFPIAIRFVSKTPYGPQLPVGGVILATPRQEILFNCVAQ